MQILFGKEIKYSYCIGACDSKQRSIRSKLNVMYFIVSFQLLHDWKITFP